MLPDTEGPCAWLILIGNKELPYNQWLVREMEAGLLDCEEGTEGEEQQTESQ